MNIDRSILDPGARYPAEGYRHVERNAERVMAPMPEGRIERTRDCIQIEFGDEHGLVVLLTPEAFEFRLPTEEWTCGAYGAAASSRLWRRVDAGNLSDEDLGELLQKALAARAAEFMTCRYCGRLVPPERRTGRACHGCATEHEGIVF